MKKFRVFPSGKKWNTKALKNAACVLDLKKKNKIEFVSLLQS